MSWTGPNLFYQKEQNTMTTRGLTALGVCSRSPSQSARIGEKTTCSDFQQLSEFIQ